MGTRLAIVVTLCFLALFYFRDSPYLAPVRNKAVDVVAVIYSVAAAPLEALTDIQSSWSDMKALREENRRLRQENLVIKGQTQRLASVVAENTRYRALLNSAEIIEADVMVAEVIGLTSDPARHLLILDKGSRDGVKVGQPLLGAEGLMGQVITVGEESSQALLISDSTHAVPVHVNRNGVRGVAEGTGETDHLIVRHIAATTDIAVGDLLVTSGLGGRFPRGYPVAVVTSVAHEPGAAFATIAAKPLAQLDKGRHVLLALTNQAVPLVE